MHHSNGCSEEHNSQENSDDYIVPNNFGRVRFRSDCVCKVKNGNLTKWYSKSNEGEPDKEMVAVDFGQLEIVLI